MSCFQYHLRLKVGSLFLVAAENGLMGSFFNKQNVPLVESLKITRSQDKILHTAAQQLTEYFNAERQQFELPLIFVGTVFQKQVWRALATIPFGKTVSYQEIARRIKNPKAVRAVGSANGKNLFCIIIPCHRVIAADGSLGGYAGGLAMKRRLLKLEKVIL
jgi:methylated-DNA-[protein]-cysteine S-methyltransferase